MSHNNLLKGSNQDRRKMLDEALAWFEKGKFDTDDQSGYYGRVLAESARKRRIANLKRRYRYIKRHREHANELARRIWQRNKDKINLRRRMNRAYLRASGFTGKIS